MSRLSPGAPGNFSSSGGGSVTQGTTPWVVDGSAVTQPISVASLPLPLGAATATKQDTGNTSLSSIDGKVPSLGQALAAASTPVVLTAAQITTLTPLATVAVTGVSTLAEQQTQTTALQLIDNAISGAGFNITQQNGVAVSLNTGVRDTGTQRVTIATNDVVPVTDNAGSLTVDAPVGTPVFVRLSDGSSAIATLPVSLASVPSHAVTNAGTFAVQASLIAATTGGATAYKLVSAATTNATNVKASAGTVYMITASNVNAAVRYLKFYNKASAPTVGTDTPVFTFAIPGNTAGAGTNIPLPAMGVNFGTGISFATTTEATDAGTTGVAISEIVINIAYI